MPDVLLTCAGRRHYLAGYFRAALAGRGRLIGADMDPTAPALTICDAVHILPPVSSPDYQDRLCDVIRAEKVDMVFSVNDLELGLLSRNRSQIEVRTGATLYVAPPETQAICGDKWQTFQFAQCKEIATPMTFLDAGAALAALRDKQISLPLIVKPRWGSGSLATSRVETCDQLLTEVARCRAQVSGSALAPLGGADCVIIQECISGPEYGLDLLFSKDETLIGFAARQKLAMRAGETDKAQTLPPDRFSDIAHQIAVALPHRGNMDVDLIERDGVLWLIDLNPRFGGGYPFSHEAGADHIGHLIAEAEGEQSPPYGYTPNLTFSKCDRLVAVPAKG